MKVNKVWQHSSSSDNLQRSAALKATASGANACKPYMAYLVLRISLADNF